MSEEDCVFSVYFWHSEPKVLFGYSGGRFPGRSTKEKGEEEEEEKESRETQVRNEVVQEVVAGIKENASAHEDAKSTAQRTVGQSVKQSWDENRKTKKRRKRKTGKRRTRWKCNVLRMRSWRRVWNEEGWKEVPCRRKSSKEAPELVVHECKSQDKGVKGRKETKKSSRMVH